MIDCGISAVQIELFGTRTIRCEVDEPRENTRDGVAEMTAALRHAFPDNDTLLLLLSDVLIQAVQIDRLHRVTKPYTVEATRRIDELRELSIKWHDIMSDAAQRRPPSGD